MEDIAENVTGVIEHLKESKEKLQFGLYGSDQPNEA